MPIYMDRHDVSESVTAENVAHLHKEDLKIQEQFNCRGLTYWYDDVKKIAFCLIEAPDKESIHNMHNCAHGEVPNLIIEVDENLVESFLGRIEDPVQTSVAQVINDPAQRTLMAVQFKTISLQGIRYSAIASVMQQMISAISGVLDKYGGRLTKHREGYLLISFTSADQAALSAVALQNIFEHKIAELCNSNIQINIGLSSGLPVVANKSFFEDTIKLADRLCFIEKSNLVISAEVQNLAITEGLNASFDYDKIYTLPACEENHLNTLIDFIEKEWRDPELKVDDFEIPLGMSRTQVYRKVTQLTGKSPNSFLKEYRLIRALEMLNQNTNSISEIAYDTGFNSLSYFSKCFQRRFGLLPSDYIKT